MSQPPIEYHGHEYLRQWLLLSLLSCRQIIIKDIRAEDENPGLRPHELSLLRLVEKLTNGSIVNINKTGTRVIFRPGIIDCNDGMLIHHECDLARSITYYLEFVVPLAIFGKTILSLQLEGVTDSCLDQSIDCFKNAATHLVRLFNNQDNTIDIQIKKRAYAPLGGGIVTLTQKYVKRLESVSLTDEGKVKRVRGVLTSARVSPQVTTRVIDKVREVLNDYIPDVWVHTDHFKKDQAGLQPGYAISLFAETTTGMLLTKDFNYSARDFKVPEDLGERTALGLLDEIFTGGAVDSTNQPLALLLMALSASDNVSQIKIGRITQQSIAMMRNIKLCFNVQFKVSECEDDDGGDEDDEDAAEGDENEEDVKEIKEN